MVNRITSPSLAERVEIDTRGEVRVYDADLQEPLSLVTQVSNPLDVSAMTAHVETRERAGSHLDVNLNVADLTDEAGTLAPAEATVRGTVAIRDVPQPLIEKLAAAYPQLAEALGPNVTARAAVDITGGEGTARVELDSNLSGTIPMRLADGVMTLTDEAPLSLKVTEASTKGLLATINPMLGDLVAAEAPINLTLQREGFRVPLEYFSIEQVSAAASLSIGDGTLQPSGVIGQLFEVLKRTNVIPEKNAYGVRLRPTTLRVENGDLRYDRFPLSIDQHDLLFSGSVGLSDLAYNLSLGFGGEFGSDLRKLTVPITGTAGNPQIDLKTLVTSLAKQQLQGELRDQLRDNVGEDGKKVLDALDGLRGKKPQPPVEGEGEPEAERPEDAIGDVLGGLLERRRNRDQNDNQDGDEDR